MINAKLIAQTQHRLEKIPPIIDAKATRGPCFPDRRTIVELQADKIATVFITKLFLLSKGPPLSNN